MPTERKEWRRENWKFEIFYKERNHPVLIRLDDGIVGSIPTQGMDVYMYVYIYSVFVLPCVGRGLAMSWSHDQGFLPTVLRNLSETGSFMDAPCSSDSQKGA
jgi:hypothetical protein